MQRPFGVSSADLPVRWSQGAEFPVRRCLHDGATAITKRYDLSQEVQQLGRDPLEFQTLYGTGQGLKLQLSRGVAGQEFDKLLKLSLLAKILVMSDFRVTFHPHFHAVRAVHLFLDNAELFLDVRQDNRVKILVLQM